MTYLRRRGGDGDIIKNDTPRDDAEEGEEEEDGDARVQFPLYARVSSC